MSRVPQFGTVFEYRTGGARVMFITGDPVWDAGWLGIVLDPRATMFATTGDVFWRTPFHDDQLNRDDWIEVPGVSD